MNQFNQVTQLILKAKVESLQQYEKLLTIIVQNDKQIAKSNLDPLLNFFIKKSYRPSEQFYQFVYKFINAAFKKECEMTRVVYQSIPLLLIKYMQGLEVKYPSVQACLREIYNKNYMQSNKVLISKQLLLSKSSEVSLLYKQHFHNPLVSSMLPPHLSQLSLNEQVNSSNRLFLKRVALLSFMTNLQRVGERSVINYLWMVYIFCGGQEHQHQTGVSLYLLEKRNMFSLFKYFVTHEEMALILLTLYELSMQRKKNKFQILSAINMIHKKAANQSMFKLSQVAQSTIHLLQDQYSDAFS